MVKQAGLGGTLSLSPWSTPRRCENRGGGALILLIPPAGTVLREGDELRRYLITTRRGTKATHIPYPTPPGRFRLAREVQGRHKPPPVNPAPDRFSRPGAHAETIMNSVQTRYRLSRPAVWPAAVVRAEDNAFTR